MIYLKVNKSLNNYMCRKVKYVCRLTEKIIVKTLTWWVTASLTTFVIARILTGDVLIGISIGSIEAIAKIFLYYFHERI